LTELEPVMFPIAESAYLEPRAAVILAKVSGREVPRATKVIAVTGGLMYMAHPSRLANSPTTRVTTPIRARDTKKAAHPLQIVLGGTIEKRSFQPMDQKWMKHSYPVTSSKSSPLASTSMAGPRHTAFLNC